MRVVFEEGCGDFNVICMSVFWQCSNTHTDIMLPAVYGSVVAVCKREYVVIPYGELGDEALDENTVYVCMEGLRMFA